MRKSEHISSFNFPLFGKKEFIKLYSTGLRQAAPNLPFRAITLSAVRFEILTLCLSKDFVPLKPCAMKLLSTIEQLPRFFKLLLLYLLSADKTDPNHDFLTRCTSGLMPIDCSY